MKDMGYSYIWVCKWCDSRECVFKTHNVEDTPHMCTLGISVPPYKLVTTV